MWAHGGAAGWKWRGGEESKVDKGKRGMGKEKRGKEKRGKEKRRKEKREKRNDEKENGGRERERGKGKAVEEIAPSQSVNEKHVNSDCGTRKKTTQKDATPRGEGEERRDNAT